MPRPYNFSAGPAQLPEAVLEQAKAEMLDWRGSGMSVMEMSHRGKEFVAIAEQAEADLRELLAIPANYKVLFLQGGASSQFAAIPLNLLRGKTKADYLNTGMWSKKAISEAKKFAQVNVVASSEAVNFTTVPARETWKCDAEAAYLHYTPNETIGGVELHTVPDVDVPLVADFSSTLLSRPVDVSRFGLIYAGAQKNIGPAGLTLVIVREDLLGQTVAGTPTMLDYAVMAKEGSMYNTPPTYAWYIAGLVFQWVTRQGGVAEMERRAIEKADLLYGYLDGEGAGFYVNRIDPACRSRMNVPFQLRDESLNADFLKGAQERGLLQLKGHKSVGGMRASIYNAMPLAGVQALVDYLRTFAAARG